MSKYDYLEDEFGDRYDYALVYLHYGRDMEKFSDDIELLDSFAKDMLADNSGKPLIIVNGRDEVVREYTKKRR